MLKMIAEQRKNIAATMASALTGSYMQNANVKDSALCTKAAIASVRTIMTDFFGENWDQEDSEEESSLEIPMWP